MTLSLDPRHREGRATTPPWDTRTQRRMGSAQRRAGAVPDACAVWIDKDARARRLRRDDKGISGNADRCLIGCSRWKRGSRRGPIPDANAVRIRVDPRSRRRNCRIRQNKCWTGAAVIRPLIVCAAVLHPTCARLLLRFCYACSQQEQNSRDRGGRSHDDLPQRRWRRRRRHSQWLTDA